MGKKCSKKDRKKMVPFDFGSNHSFSSPGVTSSACAGQTLSGFGKEAPWSKRDETSSNNKKFGGMEQIQKEQEEESAIEKIKADILKPRSILDKYLNPKHANMVKELEKASSDVSALGQELKESKWVQHKWYNQFANEITTLGNQLSEALEKERERIAQIQRELHQGMNELRQMLLSDDFMPKCPVAMGAKVAFGMDFRIGHEVQSEIMRRHPELWKNEDMKQLVLHYKYSPMSVFLHPEKISQKICDEGFEIYRKKGGRQITQD